MIPFNIRFSVLLQSFNLGLTKLNRELFHNIPPFHYMYVCMYIHIRPQFLIWLDDAVQVLYRKRKPAILNRKVKVLVSELCLTLCDPIDCSPPGSSVRGILQARILEWVAISFSRGSSQLRDQTQVFCIAGRFFTN